MLACIALSTTIVSHIGFFFVFFFNKIVPEAKHIIDFTTLIISSVCLTKSFPEQNCYHLAVTEVSTLTQAVKVPVNVTKSSPCQDFSHPDDQNAKSIINSEMESSYMITF